MPLWTLLKACRSSLANGGLLLSTGIRESKTPLHLYEAKFLAGMLTTFMHSHVLQSLKDKSTSHVSVFPGHGTTFTDNATVIPYIGGTALDKSQRLFNLTAQIVTLSAHSVTLDRAFPEHGIPTPELDFEYAIYALGATLPSPVNLWGPRLDAEVRDKLPSDAAHALELGSKANGIAWLKAAQQVIRKARSVLVVGGGALGIQFATDIADVYPEKRVTLLHSRAQLLPRFMPEMHDESKYSTLYLVKEPCC